MTCKWNRLTKLDLSKNPEFYSLDCSDNELTELDFSVTPYLESLDCSLNRLTSLDLTHNIYIKGLSLNYMPTLFKVCVWKMPSPYYIYSLQTSGSPNVYFSTDCSQ